MQKSSLKKGMEVLAIIPARGGSKSIPHKNIRILNGHPLIAYSIVSALKAKRVSRVIVSTDYESIAKISLKYGAEVPFMRPTELAQDDTPDLPVFEHALGWLEREEGYIPKMIVHLRPTSPLRTAWHIDEAIGRLANDKNADSIKSVCRPVQNPFRMWAIRGKYLEPLIKTNIKEQHNCARQLLPDVYWQNGHVDVIRYNTIMRKHSMAGDRVLPYVMDEKYMIDIDSVSDIKIAEAMMEK